ncbi:MAG: outer membrane protein transport protein [Candidatus Aminicenantes bacterium]|nr:outer membrane protein transport protein [Candidatus Aminicenantes bacterium]
MAKKIPVFFLWIVLGMTSLWAGGWNNTLLGCRALGLGGAFTGVADDPSAIFYNPGGLSFQPERLNFSIAGFNIWPDHEYVMPNGIAIHSKRNSMMPQFFLTYGMNDRVTVGLGFYTPYAGGGYDWKAEDLGFPFKSTMGILALSPTVSYKINEHFSVGFNLHFYRGILEINTESEDFGPLVSEENGSTISFGLGMFFRPHERFSMGLGVRGPAKMTLEGQTSVNVDIEMIGPVSIKLPSETSFVLPWDFEFGLSYMLFEHLLVSASAQYTIWSKLDKVEKVISDIPSIGSIKENEILNFKNILILHMGAEYQLPNGLSLRAGVGYDRSASPSDTLSIRNVDVDKFTLLGGVGYQVGSLRLDFVYILANGKEREKDLTGFPFPEKYNLNATIIGLGITFSH